jgi:hypothetical protein
MFAKLHDQRMTFQISSASTSSSPPFGIKWPSRISTQQCLSTLNMPHSRYTHPTRSPLLTQSASTFSTNSSLKEDVETLMRPIVRKSPQKKTRKEKILRFKCTPLPRPAVLTRQRYSKAVKTLKMPHQSCWLWRVRVSVALRISKGANRNARNKYYRAVKGDPWLKRKARDCCCNRGLYSRKVYAHRRSKSFSRHCISLVRRRRDSSINNGKGGWVKGFTLQRRLPWQRCKSTKGTKNWRTSSLSWNRFSKCLIRWNSTKPSVTACERLSRSSSK